ncbi:MAG TPA: hypothetical protein VJS67_08300, partial [Pseudonocardiaceae bacterium]|nr:hypothetical protein [Pseudonocardiaceae bacterium]
MWVVSEQQGTIMSDDAGGTPAQHEDRPVGQLVSDTAKQITRLMRDECGWPPLNSSKRASAWASV